MRQKLRAADIGLVLITAIVCVVCPQILAVVPRFVFIRCPGVSVLQSGMMFPSATVNGTSLLPLGTSSSFKHLERFIVRAMSKVLLDLFVTT